jgi:NAD+ synthase
MAYIFEAKKAAEQVVRNIKEYFDLPSNKKAKAIIGISGGKDSSIAAAACVKALGRDRVFGVLMPQGVQHDIDVSMDLCKKLGIKHMVLNIEEAVQSIYSGMAGTIVDPTCDETELFPQLTSVTTSNTPARIRMTVLYAMSGTIGGRVINTGNLSEDWVGYATKFGDAAGDFSLFGDFTVQEVKAMGYELGLDGKFIEKVPIDGLQPMSDEDNLGFTYAVLDRYLREGTVADMNIKVRIDFMHEANTHKIDPLPIIESGVEIKAHGGNKWRTHS